MNRYNQAVVQALHNIRDGAANATHNMGFRMPAAATVASIAAIAFGGVNHEPVVGAIDCAYGDTIPGATAPLQLDEPLNPASKDSIARSMGENPNSLMGVGIALSDSRAVAGIPVVVSNRMVKAGSAPYTGGRYRTRKDGSALMDRPYGIGGLVCMPDGVADRVIYNRYGRTFLAAARAALYSAKPNGLSRIFDGYQAK